MAKALYSWRQQQRIAQRQKHNATAAAAKRGRWQLSVGVAAGESSAGKMASNEKLAHRQCEIGFVAAAAALGGGGIGASAKLWRRQPREEASASAAATAASWRGVRGAEAQKWPAASAAWRWHQRRLKRRRRHRRKLMPEAARRRRRKTANGQRQSGGIIIKSAWRRGGRITGGGNGYPWENGGISAKLVAVPAAYRGGETLAAARQLNRRA